MKGHRPINFGPGVRAEAPSIETEERVRWLQWLVETYGPDTVGDWQDPPVSLDEWREK